MICTPRVMTVTAGITNRNPSEYRVILGVLGKQALRNREDLRAAKVMSWNPGEHSHG